MSIVQFGYQSTKAKQTFGSTTTAKQAVKLNSMQPAKDVVSFSGQKDIFKRNGIKPDQVLIKSKDAIDRQTKLDLIEKVLEAHEHAVKNKTKGNYSGRCYATNMKLSNGKWTRATNIEITGETVLCGERSALVRAWNEDLEALPAINDKNRDEIAAKGHPKVEIMAMSSYKKPGTDDCGNACSECLNWMNTKKFFSPTTKIATIEQDKETGQYILNVRDMSEQLPYWGSEMPSKTDKPINNLKLNFSDRAKKAMQDHSISETRLFDTMKKAQEAYESNLTAEISYDHNVGAASLLDPGDIITKGERMEWTRRWYEPPELLAATTGYQFLARAMKAAREGLGKVNELLGMLPEGSDRQHFLKELEEQKNGDPRINAVAYYGDDNVPYIDSLGKLSQGRGGADTIILTIRDNKIEARTILDYMPHLYISSKKK